LIQCQFAIWVMSTTSKIVSWPIKTIKPTCRLPLFID